ncbi:ankyrin repeat domain-containing protein [Leptolyngbya sp. 15MV]|nr:ankyrin repeat domain-containing protein [Leptolyngbya sp. 15MV]
MIRAAFRLVGWMAPLAAAAMAVPAAAQMFSEGYEFLKAVRERDGDVVTNALNQPGSVVVNARDITTGQTALHIVTQRRDLVWLRFLIQKGANPNIADRNGVTPLALASNLGFNDGVEALIDGGARVDVTNSAGETPLISAVHRRDAGLIRVLLANGANADRTDNSGRSAREYAALMNANSQIMSEFERADAARAGKETDKTYGPRF